MVFFDINVFSIVMFALSLLGAWVASFLLFLYSFENNKNFVQLAKHIELYRSRRRGTPQLKFDSLAGLSMFSTGVGYVLCAVSSSNGWIAFLIHCGLAIFGIGGLVLIGGKDRDGKDNKFLD